MPSDGSAESRETTDYRILHAFADHGVEAEALAPHGQVVRATIAPRPNPLTDTVRVDLSDGDDVPLRGGFDFGLFHPPCTKYADMPGVNPDDHEDLIDEARTIARETCDYWVIENKPKAWDDRPQSPAVLQGNQHFGIPIDYARGFEANFPIDEPPRHATLETETSPFFYSEKPHDWWKAVKGIRGDYPKEHVAKNALPLCYVEHILRCWIETRDEASGAADERTSYRDYDARMDERRSRERNQSLTDFGRSD